MNIEIVKNDQCTGCFACASVCPKNCIKLSVDREGFSIPQIEKERCIDCGKCVKICPACNDAKLMDPIEVYAATVKNGDEIYRSSSGGAFYLFAKHMMLKEKGYVCGAVLDKRLELKHCLTNNMEGMMQMQGSKYIQSDIKDCIPRIIDLCKSGEKVLFCGTPCQVAAVKQAVREGKEKLYTVDLVCHGVPSPRQFSEYIKKRYGDICYHSFSFRQRNRYVLTAFAYSWEGAKDRIFAFSDPFFQAFLDGHNYRESCYSCKYAKPRRGGDITIADCANAKAYHDLTGKPVSTIAINTLQGKKLWDNVKELTEYVKADFEREAKMNKQLHEPVKRTKLRDSFYTDLQQLSDEELRLKYCRKQTIREQWKHFLVWHIPAKMRYMIIKWIRR